MSKFDFAARALALQAKNTALGRVAPPQGFAWDFDAFPLRLFDAGNRQFKCDIKPQSQVSPAIFAGPQYWVAHDGRDENSGVSRSAPLASAWKARQLAEINPDAASGYTINVVPNPTIGLTFLDCRKDLHDSAGAGRDIGATTDRPFGLVCHGGRLVMGPCTASLTWTLEDAASNTWSTIRPAATAIYNISSPGPFGVPSRASKVGGADAAAVRTAVIEAAGDAWGQQGSDVLFLRLANGLKPSDSTVRVAAGGYGLRLGSGDVYVSGVELVGGAAGIGTVDATIAATRTLVFEDVGAVCSGISGGAAKSAFAIDNLTGLAIFNRCYGYDSLGGIFSLRAATGQLHALMMDCIGIDAGHAGADPVRYGNPIVELIGDARLISLNSKGSYSTGACVRIQDSAQHWDLGSTYQHDRGDLWLGVGGSLEPTGVEVNGTGRYWGHDVTVAGCRATFSAHAEAHIRLRGAAEIGGSRIGAGIIGSY